MHLTILLIIEFFYVLSFKIGILKFHFILYLILLLLGDWCKNLLNFLNLNVKIKTQENLLTFYEYTRSVDVKCIF
jgi:hypothetical protein